MTSRFIVADTRDALRTLPDASVDLVISSPPFLALRSYLPADHKDKAREIGSEATPGLFLDTLLDIVEECARVLTPHGSLCIELGDTYSGSGGAGGDYSDDGLRAGAPRFQGSAARNLPGYGGFAGGNRNGAPNGPGWPESKSLCLIPQSFAWALSYGRNPFTGRETERWRVRNIVRWCRPNPPVGALGDKFRPATSEMVVACKARDRYFDLDAVREPIKDSTAERAEGVRRDPAWKSVSDSPTASHGRDFPIQQSNPAGAPPLDWWEIPTQPYKGAHYASFPEKLVVKPIKSMCPERVCRECGEPSRRIVERTQLHNGQERADAHDLYTRTRGEDQPRGEFGAMPEYVATSGAPSFSVAVETLGWTDCGHDSWRRGITLDIFAGSGTTLAVAEGLGRDSIGIDLDQRNAELARERCGMFLTVEYPDSESVA